MPAHSSVRCPKISPGCWPLGPVARTRLSTALGSTNNHFRRRCSTALAIACGAVVCRRALVSSLCRQRIRYRCHRDRRHCCSVGYSVHRRRSAFLRWPTMMRMTETMVSPDRIFASCARQYSSASCGAWVLAENDFSGSVEKGKSENMMIYFFGI